MRTRSHLTMLVALAGSSLAIAGEGPDLVVGAMANVVSYAVVQEGEEIRTAFAVGYSLCNVGGTPLAFVPQTNNHPAVTSNLFRLVNNRFEQIGLSYATHEFCALQQNQCGQCQPAGTGCATALGVGCSNVTSASFAGQQQSLGPRWQINPTTGAFPYPVFQPDIGDGPLHKRLQVASADLEPASQQGARYFFEVHGVTPDETPDAMTNNASHREALLTVGDASYAVVFTGQTRVGQPAIHAWAASNEEVMLTTVEAPGGGVFLVGSLAIDNGDGSWDYEYAVHNLNVDRAAGSFSVPGAPRSETTNIGFHDVEYHSNDGEGGEAPFDGADWLFGDAAGDLRWEVAEPFEENPNANALRWGTLYNFRFTADAPPTTTDATIGLFKPGEGASVSASIVGPCGFAADANRDHRVDFSDLNTVLNDFGKSGYGLPGDIVEDGVVNFADLNLALNEFGSSCD